MSFPKGPQPFVLGHRWLLSLSGCMPPLAVAETNTLHRARFAAGTRAWVKLPVAGSCCGVGVPQLDRHSLLPALAALPTHSAAAHECLVQRL